MNETFKDTSYHIACLHSGAKWETEKNCWGENMAYNLPMNWYLIHREAVKLYHLMQVGLCSRNWNDLAVWASNVQAVWQVIFNVSN